MGSRHDGDGTLSVSLGDPGCPDLGILHSVVVGHGSSNSGSGGRALVVAALSRSSNSSSFIVTPSFQQPPRVEPIKCEGFSSLKCLVDPHFIKNAWGIALF